MAPTWRSRWMPSGYIAASPSWLRAKSLGLPQFRIFPTRMRMGRLSDWIAIFPDGRATCGVRFLGRLNARREEDRQSKFLDIRVHHARLAPLTRLKAGSY